METERKVELAKAIERAAREADRASSRVETSSTPTSERARRARDLAGLAGELRGDHRLRLSPGDRRRRRRPQTGLGFGMGRSPTALDAEAIGREAAERATSLLGAAKPASRTCPVVLDATVAASFVGFIGGMLCADAVQRGRSPFAGRLGEEVGSAALTLADDGDRPRRASTRAVRRRGRRRAGARRLIEAGTLAAYLHDSYTARREGGEARSTASAARSGYRSPPSVSTSNLDRRAGARRASRSSSPEAGDGVYVTDVAGPSLGRQPRLGHVLGRRHGPPDRRRRARRRRPTSSRSPPTSPSMLKAVRAPAAAAALGAVRRLGHDPGAADRRDGGRRRSSPEDARRRVIERLCAAVLCVGIRMGRHAG